MASWSELEVRLREYARQYDRDFPPTAAVERRIIARIAITPRKARTWGWPWPTATMAVRELAMASLLVLLVAALVLGAVKLRALEPRPSSPKIGVPGIAPAYFSALDFVSANVGWIAESKTSPAGPTIFFLTTDGGHSWQQKLTWNGPGPAQVRFSPDGAEGLVVGRGGVPLFRTADGGAHWQRFALPPQADQVALQYFLNAHEGWIVSYLNQATPGFAGVFHTTDGGQHWTQTARLDVNRLFSHGQPGGSLQGSLMFRDSSTGWFAGGTASGTGIPIVPPFLYITRDGGKTWTVQTLAAPVGVKMDSSTAQISVPQFFTQQDGVLVVSVLSMPVDSTQPPTIQGTYAYTTTDGGDHWSEPHLMTFPGTFEGLQSLNLIDARDWVILASFGMLGTTDSGAHWKTLTGDLPPQAIVMAIDFQDASSGWAEVVLETATPTLAIYGTTDGGAHWLRLSLPNIGA